MASEVKIGGRRFFIVSEPDEKRGWKAQVLEVLATDDTVETSKENTKENTRDMGIETSGATRSEADERALGVLQHRLREG